MASNKNLLVFAVLTAEVPDTSGEILIVKGADISVLKSGTAPINTEHINPEDLKQSEDSEYSGFNTIIGRVVSAKKIFGPEDCENEYELEAWNDLEVPLIVGILEFFDGEYAHDNAKAAASLIRIAENNKTPHIIGFSVEGSILKRDGNNLLETEIKRIAATLKPANKASVIKAVIADGNNYENKIEKAEGNKNFNNLHSTFIPRSKGALHILDRPNNYNLASHKKLKEIIRNLSKNALTAGVGNAQPSSLSGGEAIQKEGNLDLGTPKTPEASGKPMGSKFQLGLSNKRTIKGRGRQYKKWLQKTEKIYEDFLSLSCEMSLPAFKPEESPLYKGRIKEILLSFKTKDEEEIDSFFKSYYNDNMNLNFLKEPYLIVPKDAEHTPELSYIKTRQLIRTLRSMQERAIPSTEKYNNKENSILVLNPKNLGYIHNLIKNLGKDYYIYFNGQSYELRFVNGSNKGKKIDIPSDSIKLSTTPPEGHYFYINHPQTNKKIYISYKYDLNAPLKNYEEPKAELKKYIDENTLDGFVYLYNEAAERDLNKIVNFLPQVSNQNLQDLDALKEKVLLSKEAVKPNEKINDGIRKKVFYKLDNDIYMIKPYFFEEHPFKKHLQKILIPTGWASLAVRDIFSAANLKDNSENIYGYYYNEIPIVVSKWNFNVKNQSLLSAFMEAQNDPQLLQKLKNNINKHLLLYLKGCVLDYLIGNLDRSMQNIVLRDEKQEPVFIDHDHAFQYAQFNSHIGPDIFSLLDFGAYKLLSQLSDSKLDFIQNKDLRAWWNNYKNYILKAFFDNIQLIKDDDIKKAIGKGFVDRFEKIDNLLFYNEKTDSL